MDKYIYGERKDGGDQILDRHALENTPLGE